ncbi:MAG: hypothetical protein QXL51_01050 [Candidatus Aenigmatarchaeota archaeon]
MARNSKNSSRFTEGEAIGRLIALNEEIRDYNKKQIEYTQKLLSCLDAHQKETEIQHRDIKDRLEFILKYILIPLFLFTLGIKALEMKLI